MNKNFQWKNRNQNALETLKEKPLTFLHSSRHSNVHLINFMPIKQREMNSTDFADGDKTLSNFRKQNSNNIEKPVARRPSISSIQKHFPLSIVGQSLIPSREKTAWRKLRANITESFYNRIQEFQRDRQDNCSKSTTNRIMMSPRIRQNQTFSSVRNDSLILSDSIGNLCLLIRNLLQNDRFDEEKTTSLQRNVINQLGILLTHLALMEKAKVSSSFVDRSTSIDFDVFQEEKLRFVTVETQTDFEENCFSIESAQNFINSIHSRSDSSSFVLDQSKSISGENECVTLKLPGNHRPSHVRSDSFLTSRFHRSSFDKICSISETAMFLRRPKHFSNWSKEKSEIEETNRCRKRKFQYLIELQSSNTCLEGSTEFTPDFLLTAKTNSKVDDEDQTEQFGIETISSIDEQNDDHFEFRSIHFDEFSRENLCQWQLPHVSCPTNNLDDFNVKFKSELRLKHRKTNFSLNSSRSMIGQRVRILSFSR